MALQRYFQRMSALHQLFFQHQPHGGRALQGDKIQRQQFAPRNTIPVCQSTGWRHNRDKTIHAERREMQMSRIVRLECYAHLDPAFTDHFNHVFIDHIVNRYVDTGIRITKCFQYRWQDVSGK